MIGKRVYSENKEFPNNPGEYMKGENGRYDIRC
jgi:hypothetical protein